MRIRTIKPEFFTHEALFDAESEMKLPLRLAFAGLWCAADRAGRFKWEPRRLGVAILPFDKIDFSRVLHALTTRGFIIQYNVNGTEFGCIPSFSKHQVINNRERESDIPSHTESTTLTRAPRVHDACPTPLCNAQVEGKGTRNMEGNMEGVVSPEQSGKPTASAPTSRKHISENDFLSRLPALYPHADIPAELRKMDAWLLAHPGRKKTRGFIINWLNKIDPAMKINRRTEADRDRENTGLDEQIKLKRL